MAATPSRPPKKKGDAPTSTASEAARGSTAGNLAANARVRLVGLEAFVDLNDQLGTLLSFDGSRGRWQVRLDSGQVKNVRVNNLVNIAQTPPQEGKPARGVKRTAEVVCLKPQATPLRSGAGKSKAKVLEAAPKALVQRSTIPRPNRPAEGPADEGGRSAAKKPKVARDAANPAAVAGKKQEEQEEDEDAPLFSDVEELEGEEEVSETSDEDVDEEDDEEFDWEPVGALDMPKVWPREGLAPGQQGFTQQASRCLAQARLGTQRSPFVGLGMRLHQESASFLLHPDSPVERLLVDHATGTGKTLIMLRMLDNYFDDPRPKVAIFPKHAVCDNFYQELLKWPTRWRHFFCFLKPAEASLASGAKDWRRKKFDVWDINNDKSRAEAKTRGVRLEKIIRELTDSIQEALEMRHAIRGGKVTSRFARGFLEEHPDAPMPKAPLRAFRYTTAGGGASALDRDGWPKSPILKVGFDPTELNPYSGKVIIMDECHNLVRPNQMFEEQIGHLRHLLHSATRTVLAGFTGTPVGNEAAEGQKLLDVIKGKGAESQSNEGFLSCFHARASDDFPREVPVQGIPDGVLHDDMLKDLTKKHSLHGEALKRYLLKEVEFKVTPRLLHLSEEQRLARLASYCNLHIFHGAYFGAKRTSLLANVKDHAPKFYGVAKAIAKAKEKAVIMLSRQSGYKVLLEILRKTGRKHGFKVATLQELSDFNDARRNLCGERFRVLVAETSQAGEGIQFKHVRRLHLVEVPARHSDLVQRASRCVRMGGHEGLPPEERELAIEVHLVQLPSFLKKGPSSFIYRELLNAREVMSIPGAKLEAATSACARQLKKHSVKTLADFRRVLQGDEGKKLIELLTETVLEIVGRTNSAPARPLAVSMWQLRKRDDDLVSLERNLLKKATVKAADDLLLDRLLDKSVELLEPLEAMRLTAVDRSLLASLGDPPKAPPPRACSTTEQAVEAEEDEDDEDEKQDVEEDEQDMLAEGLEVEELEGLA